ncbi:hypothetical protein L345_06883, partial [Ophiophagus hannah]
MAFACGSSSSFVASVACGGSGGSDGSVLWRFRHSGIQVFDNKLHATKAGMMWYWNSAHGQRIMGLCYQQLNAITNKITDDTNYATDICWKLLDWMENENLIVYWLIEKDHGNTIHFLQSLQINYE